MRRPLLPTDPKSRFRRRNHVSIPHYRRAIDRPSQNHQDMSAPQRAIGETADWSNRVSRADDQFSRGRGGRVDTNQRSQRRSGCLRTLCRARPDPPALEIAGDAEFAPLFASCPVGSSLATGRMEAGMSAPFTSYVTSVLLLNHPRTYGLTAVQRHWRRSVGLLSDQYRPEIHYMRGPGPKWREKHGAPHTRRLGASSSRDQIIADHLTLGRT
jgi:hypothetical protein